MKGSFNNGADTYANDLKKQGSNKENSDYYSYKQDTQFTKDQTFYYCVMPGNYPATMRTVMNRRLNWVEVTFFND